MVRAVIRGRRPAAQPGLSGGTRPVERDVFGRVRRVFELEAVCIDREDRRLTPGDELRAGAGVAVLRVHQARVLARRAGGSEQRLRPSLHLAGDLDAPMGLIGRDLEGDFCRAGSHFSFTWARKCNTSAENCSGSWRNEKWLTSGCNSSPEPGMLAARNSVFSRLIASSWSPSTIHTGVAIFCRSSSVQFGWVPHILVIWARKALYSLGVGDIASYSFPARAM